MSAPVQPQPRTAPAAPVIKMLSPGVASPGDTIVLDGTNFGATCGAGYVHFADEGINWGAPGNVASFQLLHWSDTQITFLVPVKDSHGFQTTPGSTATVTVTNNSNLTSDVLPIKLKAAQTPVITSLNPATGGPGDTVVITGQDFGDSQGTGYVHFADNGINWGEPGNAAAFQLKNWSNTQITFVVPVKDSHGYQTAPGTTATVAVTNTYGLTSNTENLKLKPLPTPSIKSISPTTAAPGATIVVTGEGFGVSPGYVHFADNGVNWGEPGNAAVFHLQSWSDTQVTFLVPVKDSQGFQVTPGTTATITVTNSSGLTSNSVNLALVTAVTWPVSVNSGETQIGTTGDGHMQAAVTIDVGGHLTASTRIWDTSSLGPFTGFHGATVIALFDTFGNQIGTFSGGPWGVEGGQDRTNQWTATLTQAQRSEIFKVGVVNFYDPQYQTAGSIVQWIEANGPQLAAVAVAVAAIAAG